MNLGTMTAWQVREEIAAGRLSSVEATRFALEAIGRLNGELHAYNCVFPERALERAKAADAVRAKLGKTANREIGDPGGLLLGVPISIKDNMCTTFGTTTCSSKILENFRAPYNATVVEKLEAAGAVILGKTNLDEFAMGSLTENSAFGPSKNPWNTKCVPGGSSGGAAASCGADGVWGAGVGHGGIDPSAGVVVRDRGTEADVWAGEPVWAGGVCVVAGSDRADDADGGGCGAAVAGDCGARSEGLDELAGCGAGLSGGVECAGEGDADWIAEGIFAVEGMEPEVKAAVEAAVGWYKEQGAELVEISLPYTKYGIAAYYIIAPAEASSNLVRYDGVHYGYRTAKPEDLIDLYSASRGEGFGAEVKRRIMLGTYALSAGYADKFYLQALKVRALIKKDFDQAFEKCDVIAGPTSPTVAFEFGSKTDNPLQMYLCDVFTVTCNIAGIAGLSLPCGYGAGGLPVGLQLLGPTFGEAKLLRVARQYEAGHEWGKRKPGVSA